MADFNKNPQFKDELRPEGASKLLSFLVVIFSLILISYFGLNFGYIPLLEKRITETKDNLNSLALEISREDQDRFQSFERELVSIDRLLNSRLVASRVFDFLQFNTNKSIFWKSFDFDVQGAKLNLRGVARDYDILSYQISLINSLDYVSRYQTTNARLIEGGKVEFDLSVYFNSNFLKSQK